MSARLRNKWLWVRITLLSIPVFNGDKINSENWKSVFNECVDQAPTIAGYKLLQLRQYLPGEALKEINLDSCGFKYEAAKEQLERNYIGQRHKFMLHVDKIKNFKLIRIKNLRDGEKLADLLYMVVINLKEKTEWKNLEMVLFVKNGWRKCQKRWLHSINDGSLTKKKKGKCCEFEILSNSRSWVSHSYWRHNSWLTPNCN